MKLAVCGRCRHLRVCHRRGPCEYVERSGWQAVYNRFAKEKPCSCTGWVGKSPKKAAPQLT